MSFALSLLRWERSGCRTHARVRQASNLPGGCQMKIRSVCFAYATALLALGNPSSASAAQHGPVGGLDHVLIWTRNIDQLTSIMAVKLGFQVRPGGDFGDGVANRLIPFADKSYLELLYFTVPEAQLKGDVRSAYAATERGTLANNFALEARSIEDVQRQLGNKGWKLAPSSPMTYDPDGDGPAPPRESLWRIVGFESPPLTTGDLFFIKYNLAPPTPADEADRVVFRRHPNGAQRISAVWLLAADAKTESKRLERMGFEPAGAVKLPEQGLRGFRFDSAGETILALEPDGPGAAADALRQRGPHIYGISVAVAEIGIARRIAEWGYGREMTSYEGLLGKSFAAPTTGDLGFMLEFHQSPAPSESAARGD